MLEPTRIIDERSGLSPEPYTFRAVLKRDWPMDDRAADVSRSVVVPAGTYELERVAPPAGDTGSWLQVKGTTLGWPEQRWHDWRSPHYGSFQILVTQIELPEATRRARVETLVEQHVAAIAAPTPLEIEDTEPSDMRLALPTSPEPESEDGPTRVVKAIDVESPDDAHAEITRRLSPPQPMTAASTAPGYGRARRRRPRTVRFGGLRFRVF